MLLNFCSNKKETCTRRLRTSYGWVNGSLLSFKCGAGRERRTFLYYSRYYVLTENLPFLRTAPLLTFFGQTNLSPQPELWKIYKDPFGLIFKCH